MGIVNVPKLGSKIPSVKPTSMPDSWKYYTSLKEAPGDQAYLFTKGALDAFSFVSPYNCTVTLYGGSNGTTPLYKWESTYKWYRYDNGNWVLTNDSIGTSYCNLDQAEPILYPAPRGLHFSDLTGKIVPTPDGLDTYELFTVIIHNNVSPNIATVILNSPAGLNNVKMGWSLIAYSGYQICIGNGNTLTNMLQYIDIVGTTSNSVNNTFGGLRVQELKIPDNITSQIDLSYLARLLEFKVPTGITTLKNNQFSNNKAMQKVTLHSGITTIPQNCFNECRSLKKVEKLDNVTTIKSNGFKACVTLENIDISNVTTLETGAFQSCNSLKEITLNNNITTIPNNCFDGCNLLAKVNIPTSTTSIEDYAFQSCSSMPNITLPNTLTSIGMYAFRDCNNITKMEIPNTVTSIGQMIFYACKSLTKVKLPNALTTIPGYCFAYCESIRHIDLPDTLTAITTYAFYDCSALESLNVPSSVTVIGNAAFSYCLSLLYVRMNGAPPTLENAGAFYSVHAKNKVLVPYDYIHDYRIATNWGSATNYMITRQRGYKTFNQGDVLPTLDSTGIWAVTWYEKFNDILNTAVADEPTVEPITIAPYDGEFYCTIKVAP